MKTTVVLLAAILAACGGGSSSSGGGGGVIDTRHIKISFGNEAVQKRVKQGVDFLFDHPVSCPLAGRNLSVVEAAGHIKSVVQSHRSVVHLSSGVFEISPAATQSILWVASSIAHEGAHIELFRRGDPTFGVAAEQKAIAYQKCVTEKWGGNPKAFRGMDGTHVCGQYPDAPGC